MKDKYRKIVLVTDGTEISNAAEQTAMELAKKHSAAVVIVDTIQPRSWVTKWLTDQYEDHFDQFAVEKLDRLEKIAEQFKQAGIETEFELLFGKSSIEICRKTQLTNADLVIRYMKGKQSRRLTNRFGTTAINLIRACPCSLLLIGDQPLPVEPKVVACVDAVRSMSENIPILAATELLNAQPADRRALYCWEKLAIAMLPDFGDANALPIYLEQTEQERKEIREAFLENYDLSGFETGLQIEVGFATDIIPQFCAENHIDVAVLCSASVDQSLGLLMGSTVTDVLDRLSCSLMIVKPLNFKSPLKLNLSRPNRESTPKYDTADLKEKAKRQKAHVTVLDDIATAKRVVEALHTAGFSLENIELISNELDQHLAEIKTTIEQETTLTSVFDNALKWGSVGAATGALSIVFAPFPGIVLGAIAMGGVTGALMGGMAGVEHAVEDDTVDPPTLDEYRKMIEAGDCLVVVRGTHAELEQVKPVVNEMLDVRSHIHVLHGHQFHEHTV